MNIHESEQETVEALKKWWHENGRTVLAGVVLGLGAVIGWNAWQARVAAQAQEASRLYEQVVAAGNDALSPDLESRVETFLREHPDNGYAPLLALALANEAVEHDRRSQAADHLRFAMEHARESGLRDVARLRLARLLLDEGKVAQALAALDEPQAGELDPLLQEARGDALLAQGQREAAREAYESAASRLPAGSTGRERVQMKLDDLGRSSLAAPSRQGADS